MKIVVDTTVFENGFNSRSAEVQLLRRFLADGRSEFCVPSVVYEEAINRLRKRIGEANSRINSVQRLMGREDLTPQIETDLAVRQYKESLTLLLAMLPGKLLSYPAIGHEDVLKRSLIPSKPFVEGGRGYRDALIWYSLVELLQSGDDDIVFVSENSNDWCDKRNGENFHHDFIDELREKGFAAGRLGIVPTLAEFNRRFTVSTLPVEQPEMPLETSLVNYTQRLVDGEDLIKNEMTTAQPDSLRRAGGNVANVGEFRVLEIGAPNNVQNEPVRTLDSERRLLQFSADYRVAVDLSKDLRLCGGSVASHSISNRIGTTIRFALMSPSLSEPAFT